MIIPEQPSPKKIKASSSRSLSTSESVPEMSQEVLIRKILDLEKQLQDLKKQQDQSKPAEEFLAPVITEYILVFYRV